jgi:hypothetical protein
MMTGDLESNFRGLIEVQSGHLLKGIEENHEKLQAE